MCEATPFVGVGSATFPNNPTRWHGPAQRTARQLRLLVAADPWLMDALACLRRLGLPDAWIGAGAVRRIVWDRLAGYREPTSLDDVDVIFHDRRDQGPTREAAIERRLRLLRPGIAWSAKNQARMHRRNGHPPYRSTADALRFWLETPTCVAVQLDRHRRLHLLAPYGLGDLFAGRVRPTPAGRRRRHAYEARLRAKQWHRHWPMLDGAAPTIDG